MNTLVQSAWLLLLHSRTGHDTVVCGATQAGRPPELPGIEQQLGLYINDVPLIATPRAAPSLIAWLQDIQRCNLSMREHGFTPLGLIERWASCGVGTLFDTVIVFENYPATAQATEADAGALRLHSMHCNEQNSTPMTVYVELKGTLRLHYDFQLEVFDADSIEVLNQQLGCLLESMMRAGIDEPLEGVLGCIES